jgi:PAS domain S-box-containing protein
MSTPLDGRIVPQTDGSWSLAAGLQVHPSLDELVAARQALRAETRRLETLNRTGALLAGELDLNRLMQAVIDAAVEVTGARFGAFFNLLPDDGGDAPARTTLSGIGAAEAARFQLRRVAALVTGALHDRAPLRCDDVTREPACDWPEPRPPVRSYLIVPVISRSRQVMGAMVLGHPDPARFPPPIERIATSLAGQAAVAVDNARLFQAAQRDVQERRRAEEALRESEARFREMADHAPVTVWVIDATGRCTYVSKGWSARTGLPEELAMGRGWIHTVHPDDRAQIRKAYLDAISSRSEFRFEYRQQMADGGYRWQMDSANPRFGASGEFLGYIGSTTDIHQRRVAEERLRQAHDLEASANRAKAAFLANITHELRTPLNAIIGFSELIRSELYGPLGHESYRDYADDILSSGRLLLGLVNNLLEVTRIEAGRLTLSAEPVDLAAVVAESADAVRAAAVRGGVTLDVHLDAGGPAWQADRPRLRQVLLALIGNAVKFTPAGGRVTVSGGGDRLVIEDTGIGIAPGRLAELGQPFVQLTDDVLARSQDGVGMGLFITRSLVGLQGGGLAIESTAGVGTRVCLTWPVAA